MEHWYILFRPSGPAWAQYFTISIQGLTAASPPEFWPGMSNRTELSSRHLVTWCPMAKCYWALYQETVPKKAYISMLRMSSPYSSLPGTVLWFSMRALPKNPTLQIFLPPTPPKSWVVLDHMVQAAWLFVLQPGSGAEPFPAPGTTQSLKPSMSPAKRTGAAFLGV